MEVSYRFVTLEETKLILNLDEPVACDTETCGFYD